MFVRRIKDALTYLFFGICFLFLLLSIWSIFTYLDNYSLHILKIFFSFIFTIAYLLVITYFGVKLHKKNKKLFLVTIIFVSTSLCVIWNIFSNSVPVSDYKILLEGGYKIANGIFTEGFNKESYYYFYNYQIAYATYLSILIKAFGMNLTIFKIIEVIYIVLSIVLIYKIGTILFNNESVGAIATILSSIFISTITGSSIINNQHLSTVLLLLGIYLLLRDTFLFISLSGLIFAFMNYIRPIGIIILIGVIIYFIYNILDTNKLRNPILKLGCVISIYLITIFVIDTSFILMKLTPTKVSKTTIPYSKFVTGIGNINKSIFDNTTEHARKTAVYFDLKELDFDYNRYNNECKKYLKNRVLNNRIDTIKYIKHWMTFFLGNHDNQYNFALNDYKKGLIKNNLILLSHMQYFALVIFALLFVIKYRKDFSIIIILYIGFVAVHFFIERQTRYRYEIYIFLILMSSCYINYIFNKYGTGCKLLSKKIFLIFYNTSKNVKKEF